MYKMSIFAKMPIHAVQGAILSLQSPSKHMENIKKEEWKKINGKDERGGKMKSEDRSFPL